MKFKTEEEAAFWREAYLAFVKSPRTYSPKGDEDAGGDPSAASDSAVLSWRARRADLDKPGAPYR